MVPMHKCEDALGKKKMEDGVYEQTKKQEKSDCISAFYVDVNFIIPEHQLYTDCRRWGDRECRIGERCKFRNRAAKFRKIKMVFL